MENHKEKKEENEIISYNFNQDSTYISIGTKYGFNIINCNYPKKVYKRKLGGGIKIAEMINSSNILALVGGTDDKKFPDNKLIIWDDDKQKIISEFTFLSSVKKVLINLDKIFVLSGQKLFVFNFDYFEAIESFDIKEEKDNSDKLFSVSKKNNVLVYYADKKDENIVNIKYYNDYTKNDTNIKIQEKIVYLQLNSNGTILAVITERKKLILYEIKSKKVIGEISIEFEDKSEINSVEFNELSDYFLVAVNKKIFIYSFDKKRKKDEEGFWRFLNGEIIKYYAVCEITSSIGNIKNICAFKDNNTIIFFNDTEKLYSIDLTKKEEGKCLYEEIK